MKGRLIEDLTVSFAHKSGNLYPTVQLVVNKPSPDQLKEGQRSLASAAHTLLGVIESELELAASKRVFRAAWKGVPLCEEPRC